eukprot:m.361505 g.361505  ORF g.361505 m.361505 type:complete len:370 (-) comp19648_c0_seq1:344-1453(-)
MEALSLVQLKQAIGKSPLFRALFILLFLASGAIINLLQVLSLALWPVSPALYRRANATLISLFWQQLIWLAERWCGITLEIFVAPGTDPNCVRTDSLITVANHKSDLDWLLGWLLADKFGRMESTKCLLKSQLAYVPILGFSWWFLEFIFVKRTWEQDKVHLEKSYRRLASFPFPILLVLFAEGTRMTQKKFDASVEYCKREGITPFRHVMCPRTKGFTTALQHLHDHTDATLTLTFAFPDGEPTMDSLFAAESRRIHVHLSRTPMDQVPSNEQDASKWCMETFRGMDDLLEHHKQKGQFPGEIIKKPMRVNSVLVQLFWVVIMFCASVWFFGFYLQIRLQSIGFALAALTLGSNLLYRYHAKRQRKKE